MKIITFILVLLLVLLQYRLWIGNGSMTEVHHLGKMKQEQIEENKKLQERNRSLAAEVYDLKNGLEAIEERARANMGMIKQGEIFYLVVDRQPSEGKQE